MPEYNNNFMTFKTFDGDITNYKFSFTFSINSSVVITEPNIISKDTKVFL